MSRSIGGVTASLLALLLAPPAPAQSTAASDPAPPQAASAATLAALSARCGSEIDWCATWAQAQARAKELERPIVVLVRKYDGVQLLDTTMLAPFMDAALVELMRSRFVALRFRVGDAAPFVAPERYGIGPSAWGTTVLVVDAEGNVRADTYTLEPATLHDVLRNELPEASRPPPVRRGEEGLAQLEATLATEPARAAELSIERIELLVRLGRAAEALAAIATIPTDDRRHPAALYFRGMVESGAADLGPAHATWQQLLADHPHDRYAWIAAGLLQFGWLELAKGGRQPWPDPALQAMVTARPRAPLPVERAADAEHDAIRFLLDAQQPDGTWLFAGDVMGLVDRRDSQLVVAITALATRALLPCAAEAGADARLPGAIERGLTWLREAAQRPTVPVGMLDYTVWARAALLRCIASAIDAGFIEPDEWGAVTEATTRALLAAQKRGGGFSYYQGSDPARLDPALEVSFSFVTAYVLIALREAQATGADVPDAALAKAADCLARCRDPDSTFTYTLYHLDEKAGRAAKPSGAAGRGPECEWALQQCGRASEAEVARSLDHFMRHRAAFAREQGKTLMHCGAEGEGSHYLLFDYAFAALAVAAQPAELRERWRRPLLELLLAARTDAGSFVDNPLLGDHVGTALALEALRALKE